MVVIEMNPRVSRSSALASKATGFPIARCSAKLAAGYTLNDELIINDITGNTVSSFEPALDYVCGKGPPLRTRKVSPGLQRAWNADEIHRRIPGPGKDFYGGFQQSSPLGRRKPALKGWKRSLSAGTDVLETDAFETASLEAPFCGLYAPVPAAGNNVSLRALKRRTRLR